MSWSDGVTKLFDKGPGLLSPRPRWSVFHAWLDTYELTACDSANQNLGNSRSAIKMPSK